MYIGGKTFLKVLLLFGLSVSDVRAWSSMHRGDKSYVQHRLKESPDYTFYKNGGTQTALFHRFLIWTNHTFLVFRPHFLNEIIRFSGDLLPVTFLGYLTSHSSTYHATFQLPALFCHQECYTKKHMVWFSVSLLLPLIYKIKFSIFSSNF